MCSFDVVLGQYAVDCEDSDTEASQEPVVDHSTSDCDMFEDEVNSGDRESDDNDDDSHTSSFEIPHPIPERNIKPETSQHETSRRVVTSQRPISITRHDTSQRPISQSVTSQPATSQPIKMTQVSCNY